MSRQAIGTNCTIYCWSVGVVSGVLAFIVLWGLLGATPLVALLLGAALAVGSGYFLVWAFCDPLEGPQERAEPAAAMAAPPPTPSPTPAAAPRPTPSPTPAAAPAPLVEALEPEPVADPFPEPASEAATEAIGSHAAPRSAAAPDGEADDLKRIRGVGPKLEERLNSMGIWHFRQIAFWTDEDIAWVDATLNFRGRIVRDEWIAQARVLSEGREAGVSKGAEAT